MPEIIAVDRDDDLVTQYSQAFRESLVFSSFNATYPQHQLHRVSNGHATRASIDALVATRPIRLITGSGHGRADSFLGHQSQVIWSAAQDLSYLTGTIVHLLSCQAGLWLGRAMVDSGVTAFWGYSADFNFFMTDPRPTQLDTDDLALKFFEMDMIVLRGILDGRAAEDIVVELAAYYLATHSKLTPAQASELMSNYYHLVGPMVTWGDEQAVL